MSKELRLDVDTAGKLKSACRKAGWTNEDMEALCRAEMAEKILPVIRGTARIILNDLPELKVFRTIKLGTILRSADEFVKALEVSGCCVGDWARDIMSQPGFRAASEKSAVDLVALTVGELGFSESATYREICDQATKLGLELCPPEVGPQLRLQYLDQPHGEWLIIAMEPITDSDGRLDVFDVRRNDLGCWLYTAFGYPDYPWDAGRHFVFLSSK